MERPRLMSVGPFCLLSCHQGLIKHLEGKPLGSSTLPIASYEAFPHKLAVPVILMLRRALNKGVLPGLCSATSSGSAVAGDLPGILQTQMATHVTSPAP